MFGPTNQAGTFNQDKSNLIQKNLDNNGNESLANVPDKSGSIDSTRSDRKPDDKAENLHPRERRTSERKLTVKIDEDIIDGFLFLSFETYEDLNAAVEQVRFVLFLKLQLLLSDQ